MDEGASLKLQEAFRQVREKEKELVSTISNRQILEGQLKENEIVLQELQLLEQDSGVYKMIGGLLLKQEKTEAIANVSKRVEFINAELKRTEGRLKELQQAIDSQQKELLQLQQAYRTTHAVS